MPVQVVDLRAMAHEPDAGRQVLMDGPRFHAWLHVYPTPGQQDDMHCHNADQTFHVIEGECTMHFPDGGKAVLKPGMAALITAGSFYKLENSGTGKMVMMGNRALSQEAIKHINFETRKDIKGPAGELPRASRILV